jgi:leader peptidase (prepilin peptidase)/N-methyltransferase
MDLPLLALWFSENAAAFVAGVFLLGLAVGSFLNVVIHRLPRMMERDWRRQCAELDDTKGTATEEPPFSLATPASTCPHCGHRIRWFENIPLLSYLFLRGKCSACGQSISLRYPIIELVTALLSVAVAWHFGWSWQAGAALLLTWALIALSMIDFDHQLLPDSITLPFLWLGLLLSLFPVFADARTAIIGALAGYLSLWLLFHAFRLLTGKEGMGYGDFKLLAMLGAWMGWQALPVVILLSSVVGAVVGIGLILFLGRDRQLPIPFGPYLAAAGWITLLWGSDITGAYLRWVGLAY